jgi:Cu-Zn family superoxide dismutase
MKIRYLLLTVILGSTISWAADAAAKKTGKAMAVATVAGLGTNTTVRGTIKFTQEAKGVRVNGTIEGLPPGEHGFHIHEKGDCSSADGMSAGGHFNPHKAEHGGPSSEHHHSGDFGNIKANDKGVAKINEVFDWLSLSGDDSIIGRAVIVHAKADDLKSQPAGNAGGRIGCGVISVPK